MPSTVSYPSVSRPLRATTLALAISLLTTSCASVDNFAKNNSPTINCVAGGVMGAFAGAAVGALTKGDSGAIVGGAAAGAAAGCGLALLYKGKLDRLEKLAREENLKMQVETLQVQGATPSAAPKEAGIVAQIEDQGMFPVGSARLSVDGERQVRKLASAFAGEPGKQSSSAILVVGHTDATGTAAGNQALSEQRARAVASILAEQGIARERMYFQGAGASRPVADNGDPLLRGQNRRVEIVEVNDRAMLVQRVNAEQNNPRYLAHGTTTEAKPRAARPAPSPTAAKPAVQRSQAVVDFGGQPAASVPWDLAQQITPKSGGFALVSKAYANEIPMSSCAQDSLRLSGEVKSLATGETLQSHATREYLPGMNGRAWAGLVNGHLVTLSPVAVLRENAALAQAPKVYVTRDYAQNKGKASHTLSASANTYEGENAVLYRVFVEPSAQAPVSCVDVVIRKAGDKSLAGKLYYQNGGEPFAATYTPVRS
ncbi:Outer membrane protein OmpA [Pseudomonas cuatrocienegasensis]|uniref:Outer membrane protein OmpA n=1 Tax=Pseudomonas cuatrocienegasensis TaxID=543360 RepID=A0ABY1BND1_9PSED|nr:Outer membrane protein OmpA [Pseudomonas cuatrocienegasensis]